MTSTLSEQASNKIKAVNGIYGVSLKVYKDCQILYDKIDDRIQNEYCYCSRAQATLLECLLVDNYSDDFDDALENYSSGSKNALNDSLDLIFAYAKKSINELSGICRYSGISDVFPEVSQVNQILKKYTHIISQSREDRGQERIAAYLKMANEEEYKILYRFCMNVEEIQEDLKKIHRKEQRHSQGNFLMVILGILAISATVIVAIITI